MKKILLSAFPLFCLTLIIVSCQKTAMDLDPKVPTEETQLSPTLATSTTTTDLTITSYTTNVTRMTTNCSPVIDTVALIQSEIEGLPPVSSGQQIVANLLRCPNISCDGGVRFFTSTIIIKNLGNANLPAGDLSVLWKDWSMFGSSSQTGVYPHTGIPVGDSTTVSRTYYVGPCDIVPGSNNYFKHNYNATVFDSVNSANNTSPTFMACDGPY